MQGLGAVEVMQIEEDDFQGARRLLGLLAIEVADVDTFVEHIESPAPAAGGPADDGTA